MSNSEQRVVAREDARKLLGDRRLIFEMFQGQALRINPDTYRRFVEMAVEFGATHVAVTLPFRYNSWVLPDNTDPYAAWCVTAPALLRVCPPPELQEWVLLDQAREAQQALRAQLDLLKPYGLKAVTGGVEPMWLPEGVYRAHPRWLGAQCELGRIASRPYFTPSIDEPEVLDLYRRATREFCTLFPEIDQYSFMTNDSGAGVSWSPNIYPGMNGPARWRTRDGGERVAGWLQAVQAGAQDAGTSLRMVMFSAGWPAEWIVSARAKLPSGIFVSFGNNHGERWAVAGAGMGGGVWGINYPVVGLGDPIAFLSGLQGVYGNPDNDSEHVSVNINEREFDRARLLLETYLDNPGKGLLHRTTLSLEAADRMTGSAELSERLVGVWESVRTALHNIAQIRQKGFGLVMPFCEVSMRWLIRPLVPAPEQLTPEETAYYRNFLFAVESQKDDPHFGYVLGKGEFRGESVMWMTRWCLQEAINILKGARASVEGIAGEMTDPALTAKMRLYAARLGALTCLATNARNVVMYQYALDVAGQPQYGPNPMDYDDNMICDMRALSMRKIAREEFDNIAELVEILEGQPEIVLEHAECPEEENVFMLSPHLVEDLKHKLNIMLDHWQDYENMYPTAKVWDFDPPTRGNIV